MPPKYQKYRQCYCWLVNIILLTGCCAEALATDVPSISCVSADDASPLQQCSTLTECAMDVVLKSIVNETLLSWNKPNNKTYNYRNMYAAPCASVQGIQESTSALLTARALSKYGNSYLAWNIIQSMFDVQGINGFLPKYRFSPLVSSSSSPSLNNNTTFYYIPNTKFPYKQLFNNNNSYYDFYHPTTTTTTTTTANNNNNNNNDNNYHQSATSAGITSSIPLSAIPLHSTIVLDVFYLSSQTDEDLLQLEHFFTKLYQWHFFLFSNRSSNSSRSSDNIVIVHPWESTIPMHSPLWEFILLKPVMDEITRMSWKCPFIIPKSVKSSIDYPGDDMYNVFLYLLLQQNNTNTNNDNNTSSFSMVDVGFSAILAKSNRDLLQIAQILKDKRCSTTITQQQWDTMNKWIKQSTIVLEENSWNDEHSSFVSQYSLVLHQSQKLLDGVNNNNTMQERQELQQNAYKKSNSRLDAQYNQIPIPVSDNFLVYNGIKITNKTKSDYMIFHLLQEKGCFSFHIGGNNYPVVPVGGDDTNNSHCRRQQYLPSNNMSLLSVSPTLNYWVSNGLILNNEHGLGHYIRKSVLNLICHLPNNYGNDDVDKNNASCHFNNNNSIFSQYYNGLNGEPLLSKSVNSICCTSNTTSCCCDACCNCESTWTETAAIVYDMLQSDKNFTYTSAPPISSGWIFLFMTIELGLTLSVGIGCFVFSFNLRRRLAGADDDLFEDGEEAFVRMSTTMQHEEQKLLSNNNYLDLIYGEESSISISNNNNNNNIIASGSGSNSVTVVLQRNTHS